MRRSLILLVCLALLACVPALARRNSTPQPTPTPLPRFTEQKSAPLTMSATLLDSVQDRNSDGYYFRDDIVLIESLTNNGLVPVNMSYQAFYIKDPSTGTFYQARGTNEKDLEQDNIITSADGAIPAFKLFFRLPGNLRPDHIYLQVDKTVVVPYDLSM
ncbi:MAG: hypothetical protein ACYCW6_18740 [Candidatus Xenobia bacterium]